MLLPGDGDPIGLRNDFLPTPTSSALLPVLPARRELPRVVAVVQIPEQRPRLPSVGGARAVGVGVGGRGGVVVVLVALEDVDGGDLHVGEADAAGPLPAGGDGLAAGLGVGGGVVGGEVLRRHRRRPARVSEFDRWAEREKGGEERRRRWG